MTLSRERDRWSGAAPRAHLRSFGRYARLLAGSPASPGPHPGGPRLIVSLTTIPSRAAHLRPTLNSLLDQDEPADEVLLALPRRSVREDRTWPPLDLPDGVRILDCDDLGPATKLLPALRSEAPDTLLVAVDDDVVYPRDFLANLRAAHHDHPEAAVGLRGWRIDVARHPKQWPQVLGTALRAPTPVDVLLGTWGFLVRRSMFDERVFDDPGPARWVDDVWFSGQLAVRGVPRRVIPATVPPIETPSAMRAALTRTVNRDGTNDVAAVTAFAGHW